MLGFVQNWFAPKPQPIGVDFGSDSLRLAQVHTLGPYEHKLVAAASCDVPSHLRHDPVARLAFFTSATRDLLSQGGFRGRQAVLCLPSSVMHVLHLRMGKLDDAETRKAIKFEARGKLPIDPNAALIRHLNAGEIFCDNEPKNEVIVLAARRDWVDQYLSAAAKAKLDVVGMNVEPSATIDCFTHVYRRKTDEDATNCFVDIGFTGTRAVVARGGVILFARNIPIGGEQFTRAVADALKIGFEDAKLLRIKQSLQQPALDEKRERLTVTPAVEGGTRLGDLVAPGAVPFESNEVPDFSANELSQAHAAEQACRKPVERLASELSMCRRYYESTFPSKPIERLIFIGGEARHRSLCQSIARSLQLAAQVGDPMVRMARKSEIGIESGIDRRQPQPNWAVALGLSMGPVGVEALK